MSCLLESLEARILASGAQPNLGQELTKWAWGSGGTQRDPFSTPGMSPLSQNIGPDWAEELSIFAAIVCPIRAKMVPAQSS